MSKAVSRLAYDSATSSVESSGVTANRIGHRMDRGAAGNSSPGPDRE
jgi:hypothetical protein